MNDLSVQLSNDEIEWIRMKIKQERKREQLYDAIIEKSLPSLIVAAFVGLASLVVTYVKSHWR